MVCQQNNEILSRDGQNKFVARARGDFSSLQFFWIPDFLRVCLPCAKQKRMNFLFCGEWARLRPRAAVLMGALRSVSLFQKSISTVNSMNGCERTNWNLCHMCTSPSMQVNDPHHDALALLWKRIASMESCILLHTATRQSTRTCRNTIIGSGKYKNARNVVSGLVKSRSATRMCLPQQV